MHGLTIGEVAKQADVNLETLRYYERRGLIPPPPRSPSNYRLYPSETVTRVHFVKRAKELGFLLDEIKELLSLHVTRGAKCSDVRERAITKIRDIDEKIRSLQAVRKALSKLAAECVGDGPVSECQILETLRSERKI